MATHQAFIKASVSDSYMAQIDKWPQLHQPNVDRLQQRMLPTQNPCA
jgi:hypothetical protein